MPNLDQFTYHLPHAAIAQKPAQPRDSSNLMVVNRKTGAITPSRFHSLADFLQPTDILVRNNTKVIPARIFGKKTTGGQVEILLTKRLSSTPDATGEIWECLTKPGLKPNQTIIFESSTLAATCTKITGRSRHVAFNASGSNLFSALEKIGHTPTPPYIEWHQEDDEQLRQLYQTTYAKIKGSAAAPTAGLHFTPELDEKIRAKGITILEVTLHVGLGTFLRVKTDDITQHTMHSEYFELSNEVAEAINQTKTNHQRIIAVGTTSNRVLESCVDSNGQLQPQNGETDLYIYPPYQFKVVDGLITNFHEPRSTLLMLVSAFCSAPNTDQQFTSFNESLLGKAYQTAIENDFRLLSFGDGMLIL